MRKSFKRKTERFFKKPKKADNDNNNDNGAENENKNENVADNGDEDDNEGGNENEQEKMPLRCPSSLRCHGEKKLFEMYQVMTSALA